LQLRENVDSTDERCGNIPDLDLNQRVSLDPQLYNLTPAETCATKSSIMTLPDQTEVLVIGAGPVGLLTALGLAQQGIDTLIIGRGLLPEDLMVRNTDLLNRKESAGRTRKIRPSMYTISPHHGAPRGA